MFLVCGAEAIVTDHSTSNSTTSIILPDVAWERVGYAGDTLFDFHATSYAHDTSSWAQYESKSSPTVHGLYGFPTAPHEFDIKLSHELRRWKKRRVGCGNCYPRPTPWYQILWFIFTFHLDSFLGSFAVDQLMPEFIGDPDLTGTLGTLGSAESFASTLFTDQFVAVLRVATQVIAILIIATYYGVTWAYPVRTCSGNDQDMPNPGKSHPRGGGGGGKRAAASGAADSSADGLASAFEELDLRDAEQIQADNFRRMVTQCTWIGWQKADEWDRDFTPDKITSKGNIFRRCRQSACGGGEGRCKPHIGKTNGDPKDPKYFEDPESPSKEKKKKGLSPNDVPGARALLQRKK